MKLILCCAVVILAVLTGCRAIGPAAEEKLGITALELRQKSQLATDPNGILKKAQSFETVQEVEELGKNLVGREKRSTSLEIIRYRSPFYVSVIQILAEDSVQRLVANPRGIWQIDIMGEARELTRPAQKASFEFMVAELNPKTRDSDIWKNIVLEESDLNPDSWYKLVFYPKGNAIRSETEYIEKGTFLTRRIEVDFGYRASITEIPVYRKVRYGMQMPETTINYTSDGKTEAIRHLKSFRINCLKKDCSCDFEPETPLNQTLPGCRGCGPEPKPRRIYVPTP